MDTRDEEVLHQILGHFNLELFYFSHILDIFSENPPIIDRTSVIYLKKIMLMVNDLLKNKDLARVYNSEEFVQDDFDNVTLERNFHCHSCNEKVPFLWRDYQEHLEECGNVPAGQKKPPAGKKSNVSVPQNSKASKAKNPNNQPIPGTSKDTPKGWKVKDQEAQYDLIFEEDDDYSSDSTSSEEMEETELQKVLKELKELKKAKREIKKANKKKLKQVNVFKKDFGLKKKTKMLLKMVDETISSNKAIGEKIINLPIYKDITDDLEDKLQHEYPEVKVYIFGSRKTGLGTHNGDLDLFVDVNNYYDTPMQNKEECVEIIEKVRDILSQPDSKWSKLISIPTARTPILKTYHAVHRISCDLSFCNGLSHINTALIRYLLTLQPDCHNVACFVKAWYKSVFSNKHEANKVSSYMITLLVIFYMQTIKLLPPIHELQDTTGKPLMIGDWQGDFTKPTLSELHIEASNCPKKILAGFFDYYSRFDYEKYIICPFMGCPIERCLFDTPELLPNEMIRYKEFVQKLTPCPENAKELLATDTTICVQDPLELCHNVAKGMHIVIFAKFIKICQKSWNELRGK